MAIPNTLGLSQFDVPAGDVAIVKHMSFWCRDDHPAGVLGSAITVALDFSDVFIWDIKGPTAMSGVYQWSGWEVFTAHMFLEADSLAYSFRASGTLLTPT